MESQCFSNKRILVTGAGSGIGNAIAKKLYALGASVVAVSKTQSHLDVLQRELVNAITVCVDLSDWQHTRLAIEKVLPIDMVVNNAGIVILDAVLDVKPDDFDRVFSINAKAALNISQVVCRDLIKRGCKGSILNVSSQASKGPLTNHLSYCSSKATLDMMTRCFALEMGAHGIRFNTVNPTVVMTAMGRHAWSDPQKSQQMLSRIPSGRFVEIDEVVDAVVFMLSDSSEIINGHSLVIDGGMTAC